MNHRHISILVAAIFWPILVQAQLPGGMGGGRPRGGMSGRVEDSRARELRPPTTNDILKSSPLRLLLEKREELALTDSQYVAVMRQTAELDEKLRRNLLVYDSLRTKAEVRRPSGDARSMSQDERQQLRSDVMAVRQALTSIRATEDSTASSVLAMLTERQRPKASELLQKRREKIDEQETMRRPAGQPGGMRGRTPPAAKE